MSEADRLVGEVIKRSPKNAIANKLLANIRLANYFNTGDMRRLDEAERYLETAINAKDAAIAPIDLKEMQSRLGVPSSIMTSPRRCVSKKN